MAVIDHYSDVKYGIKGVRVSLNVLYYSKSMIRQRMESVLTASSEDKLRIKSSAFVKSWVSIFENGAVLYFVLKGDKRMFINMDIIKKC